MSAETPCYVGLRPCGCICAAAVDAPDNDKKRRSEDAREVAKWMRAGLTIERWTVEKVRAANWAGCPTCNPPKRSKRPSQKAHSL
jgi:hypothetical protein